MSAPISLPVVATIKMDSFGRVLIPKSLRDEHGLSPGTNINVHLDAATGEMLLKPISEVPDARVVTTDWGWPVIVSKKKIPQDFDVVQLINEGRDSAIDQTGRD